MESETYLKDIPSDGISSLKFGQSSGDLLVSSWDNTLSLYDDYTVELKLRHKSKAAILCADFNMEETGAYFGGLEQKVKKIDFVKGAEIDIGHHDEAIRTIEYDLYSNCLYTGSWDKSLKIWDERTGHKEVTKELNDKVYAMSVCRNKVAVAMANNKIAVFDTRSSKDLEFEDDTGLGKHQIRWVQCMPEGEGYAAGSIEGRIAIEYFPDTTPPDTSNFSYKWHRVSKEDEGTKYSYIYPVNDISFHPVYKTFASWGSDGLIATWDPVVRKRIWKKNFDCGITSISFNKDGSKLAAGLSYNYDNDINELTTIPEPAICILKVADSFVKAKAKK